ncbi:bifunctional metallophosphatase/5'-nucleotidase [Parerythrobacter lacustris]|uniref:Bifunctional metallophosphatase/5'-nucleotidase n=1 Tax=Parerythrobacter lacustris TaxID=2969984 RepID=A0ABT1XPJ3_9SPHN|nr:bifunctional UDP-sugar hydrolase/5'-nucleotidase [Parerythrobacter lacustris]MCR2832545.1 bifunctional metallophosphatase/5'-nucleotidase [Parerythrobacter lacustris]
MFRAILTASAALGLAACATVPQPQQAAPKVPLRIVGLNDFHGNLEPIRRPIRFVETDGTEHEVHAAGAAWLASAVAETRAKDAHSLVIAAGDLIGGSPLVSSIFLDEPAIGAMNRLGLDFNAVGNHEFDRGWKELKRIQDGGCEKHTLREPCAVEQYAGADFAFLAANVIQPDGATLFPAYGLRRFGEGNTAIAVGVIGLTLKDTPTLVTPSGVAGLTFEDEAASINRAVGELAAQGADAIIVSIHQGLYTEVGYNDKSCGGVSGPLIDILKQVDPRVDLVISGHTHRAYVCDFTDIDPARRFWVTSAGYGGSLLTDILLEVDPAAGDARVVEANNVVVMSTNPAAQPGEPTPIPPGYRRFAPDAEVAAYVARYSAAASEAATRPVGRISGEALDPGPATEETALGNLIADAQLFGTSEAGAQIALMNNSGVRTGLVPAADGTVTYGDIYAVQPFGNTLITKSFTGAQLLALLEQQFDDEGFVQTFSPSAGFAMTYDMRRPAGQRLVSATLNGEPIDPAKTYRVTMNSFLAAGGDSFTVFNEGSSVTVGAVDLDAMEEYLRAVPMRQLPALGRVTELKD